MRRLAILLMTLTLPGCALVGRIKPPKNPPTPTPQPTVAPPRTINDAMLLRTQGGVFIESNGVPFKHIGVEQCCFSEPSEPNPGWPLATREWIDYVASKGGTLLHFRVGPWRIESDDTGTAFRGIGAQYKEVNGKADLTQWNPEYWNHVDSLIYYAATKGIRVQVVIHDDWGTKWCKHGGYPGRPNWEYHPWQGWNNVQGQDWCARSNTGAIVQGDGAWGVYETWVRKVVKEFGRHGSVIWVIGNETNLVPGYSPAWDISIAQIIKDEEAKNGYLTHLIGTNSETAAVVANPLIDYSEWHQGGAILDTATRCKGKPCAVNEYNPEPPMSPEGLFQQYCAARAAGSYFWYWRHGQGKGAMDRSLDLIRQGCSVASGCSMPSDWQNWKPCYWPGRPWPPQAYGPCPGPLKVGAAAGALGASQAARPDVWNGHCMAKGKGAEYYIEALEDVAYRAREAGECAFWSDDAVLIQRGDGTYETYNLLAWGTGCARPAANAYVGTWRKP